MFRGKPREGKPMSRYAHVTIRDRERRALEVVDDATRLREIRDWHRRLLRAHTGGYQLSDMRVETVVHNVAFLLRLLDERA
jgi:hypothetical protein